jgi:hypothetical protein
LGLTLLLTIVIRMQWFSLESLRITTRPSFITNAAGLSTFFSHSQCGCLRCCRGWLRCRVFQRGVRDQASSGIALNRQFRYDFWTDHFTTLPPPEV